LKSSFKAVARVIIVAAGAFCTKISPGSAFLKAKGLIQQIDPMTS